jgi:hypothetical protein
MRNELGPQKVGRWDWYGRGDSSRHLQPARGTDVHPEDNSAERILWEFGLVVVSFLACAVIAEIAIGIPI